MAKINIQMEATMKKAVQTDKAPQALAYYSQAVIFGNLVFCSGQIALDPATGQIVGQTLGEQAHGVFKNLAAVLDAAGSSLDKVLKVTLYLTDINDYAEVNQIYAQYFKGVLPARVAVAVSALPRGAKIEAEAIAYTT